MWSIIARNAATHPKNGQNWRRILHRPAIDPTLDVDLAVAAVAVTVQKHDLGLVEKPGAYLKCCPQFE